MLQLVQSLSLAKLLPALIILNILLSSASSILVALHKQEIPLLSDLAGFVKKVIDFVSANQPH